MINCPVCKKELKGISCEGQEIDLCLKCGGVWFDNGELLNVVKSLISKNEVTSQTIQEAYGSKIISRDEFDQIQRKCPRCNIHMKIVNYCYDSNIFLDQCESCQGVWCDKGEIKAVAKYIKGNPNIDSDSKAIVADIGTRQRRRGSKGKIAACVIALFYLGGLYFIEGFELPARSIGCLPLSLACIFFGNELGSITRNRSVLTRYAITKPTPGIIIVFMGWVLLFLPMFLVLYAAVMN